MKHPFLVHVFIEKPHSCCLGLFISIESSIIVFVRCVTWNELRPFGKIVVYTVLLMQKKIPVLYVEQ